MAIKRRVPKAKKFNVVRKQELEENPELIALTDPEVATTWVAVIELEK